MQLDFSQNNMHMVFEVSDDKSLRLLHFSNCEFNEQVPEAAKPFYPAAEVHITGENPDDHHGAKHTGTSGSKSLKYVKHEYFKNSIGNKLEFTLQDAQITATLHYQFYESISAVRAWIVITNISQSNVGLEYISSFALTGIDAGTKASLNDKLEIYISHNSWVREVNWKKCSLSELGFDKTSRFSTKRINISNTGTWSSKEYLPMAAITNTETETTLMWQIENNGSWQWEIGDVADKLYLKLSGPTENENQWYKELKPGESFESVKAAIALGTDFNSSLAELTKYRRKIIRKSEADKNLPVIFNDYMNCLFADPTEEKMIPIIDKAAEAGAEYYCMDAGWYADGTWWETVGEWQPCGWRFKNGIKKVFDYIKNKGMIPGIWLEIEVMGINCPILDRFSDDCFFVRHGKRVIDHGRYQLDFRNEKVRIFATSVIDRVVCEYGAGYIKMDYNIESGMGTENRSDSFGDGLLEHNRAYLAWISEMLNKYPGLIIENCSSGGMRMDYASLSVYSIQSVTDMENYLNMAAIAAAAATAVLPEQAAIWSYPVADDDENAVIFNMVNSMPLRIHLSGQISDLSDDNFNLVKQGISCYKQIRKNIPEFIPFYPAGIPDYNSEWLCSGYKADKDIYLCVWRKNSDCESLSVPLKGSVKTAHILYPCNKKSTILPLKEGILITLPKKNSAIICKISL